MDALHGDLIKQQLPRAAGGFRGLQAPGSSHARPCAAENAARPAGAPGLEPLCFRAPLPFFYLWTLRNTNTQVILSLERTL